MMIIVLQISLATRNPYRSSTPFPLYTKSFLFKKTITENIKVEKKWNTITKKIEVPVSFEEVYINGKDLKSYGKEDEYDILSELYKRIIKSLEDSDDAKKIFFVLEKNESKREVVPLYDNDTININDTTVKQ